MCRVYKLLMNEEVAPKDPRIDEDGEEIEIQPSASKVAKYEKDLETFEAKEAVLWGLIFQSCEPHCSSIIQNVKFFDYREAWDEIQRYFNRTQSSTNTSDAWSELNDLKLEFTDVDDHNVTFRNFCKDVFTVAETLRNVHNRECPDDQLILKIKAGFVVR